MGFAAVGWLPPVAGAMTQEVIDVAVILNALRALSAGQANGRRTMPVAAAGSLQADHAHMEPVLDRLREIADALDQAEGAAAVALISEADRVVAEKIVPHERDDESEVYPRVAKYLADRHGLGAMSRAHREIIHQSRLLGRLAGGLSPEDVDPYLIRDAQRVIESIEALVRIHNAQEEDIYEYAIGA
jgi:Hemerythrin HHE cation binding domain